MTGISFDFKGTSDLRDVLQLSLYEGNAWGRIDISKLIVVQDVHAATGHIRMNVPLPTDTTLFVLTVKQGMTWSKEHRLMQDEWGGACYSCITSIDEKPWG